MTKETQYSFNLADTDYQLDILQNRMLEFYLRADRKFRQAFYTNYTSDFIQYLKDKVKLNEPIHISIMGETRNGKSSIAITIGILHQSFYNQEFNINYICANSYEYLEKLQNMPTDELRNRLFVSDEDKNIFGVGSVAKKMKIQDTQNIIAVNNVSTISICPTRFANQDASYGLRVFGRCFKTKTVRLMLYNLTEKGSGGGRPLGMVYLPIFNVILPKKKAEKLDKEYRAKKQEWVDREMRGEGDILAEMRNKHAQHFVKDVKYLDLKTKKDRLTYVSQKLGSEYTRGEVEEIESISKLIMQGSL